MHPKSNFPVDQHKRKKPGPPAYHEPNGAGAAQKAAMQGSRDLLKAIARHHAKRAKDNEIKRAWETVEVRA